MCKIGPGPRKGEPSTAELSSRTWCQDGNVLYSALYYKVSINYT